MNDKSFALLNSLKKEFKTLNPFHIIDSKGIYLEYVPFNDKTMGLYMKEFGESMILINEKLEFSPEKYFFAAHELHHALEHSELTAYYLLNSNSKGKMEQEANSFGLALCMNLFIEEHGHEEMSSIDLKQYYGVPLELSEILL